MKTREHLTVARAAVALLLMAPVALGQAPALRYKVSPGQRRVYERSVRTETVVRSEKGSRRIVTEVPVRREELVVETKAEPPSMRVATLEVPVGERILAMEENGQDRLGAIPAAKRLRPLPPLLSSYWRDLRGRPIEKPPLPEAPMQAIERVREEMQYLPQESVTPGQTWSREVDLGLAKAVITTKFAEQRAEGGTPAAVLESTATVDFIGDYAHRIKVKNVTSRMAVAMDGSGRLSHSGSMTIDEKIEGAEQHVVRSWQEKFIEMSSLAPDALARARKNLGQLEKAMVHARANELDDAIKTLDAYLKEDPQGAWTPAVQNLRAALSQRALLTNPVAAPRLRLMLRDLQAARDQAGGQEDGAERIAQVDQTLRRITKVNAKALLMDAADPDPVVRDLAAFGLAFCDDTQAPDRLKVMARDASGQVRGTALIGLAIQGRPIEHDLMVDLLKDANARVRGAAALVAARTIKKDDPKTAALLPLLLENLKVASPWARVNTVGSIAALAPSGSVPAVRALIDALKAEKEERLKPAYLAAMKQITGVDANQVAPFEEWLKKPPATKPAPTKPKPQG